MTRAHILSLPVVLVLLAACSSHGSARPEAAPPGIEDIFVVRSLREARATPGDFCAAARTGFTARIEDHYVFKADESTSAHIPWHARSALAPITESGARHLRQALINRFKR